MKNWCTILKHRGAILRGIRGGAEGWLFLRALLFASTVPLQMRLRLPTLNRWLLRRFPEVDNTPPSSIAGQSVLRGVDAALEFGRPLVRPGCLSRGLTRYYFLRRARVAVVLCFGIRRRQGELVAEPGHCWLEWGGEPYLELSDPRLSFVPIYQLPEGSVPAAAKRCSD